MITNLSAKTLDELAVYAIYGVATLVLFFFVQVAIVWVISRKASSSQDAGFQSAMSAMGRSFFLVMMYLSLIMMVFDLLVYAVNVGISSGGSPAEGVWAFFNVDWLNPLTMRSVSTGVLSSNPQYVSQGEWLVMIMAFTKATYLIILAGYLFLVFGFTTTIFLGKVNRGVNNDSPSVITAGQVSIVAIFSLGVFGVLMSSTMGFIGMILEFSNTIGATSFANTSVSSLTEIQGIMANVKTNMATYFATH